VNNQRPRPRIASGIIVLALAVCLAGCGKTIENPNSPKANAERKPDYGQLAPSLNVLTRRGLIDPAVLGAFEQQYGVHVNLTFFETIEAALHALDRQGQYDVALGSSALVATLLLRHALAPLDHSTLTNLDKTEPVFKAIPIDPEQRFQAPYLWRTIGIGYNVSFETEIPLSWKMVLEPDTLPPEQQAELRGHITMFNEGRYVIGSALVHLGFSPNTADPTQIDRAVALLQRQRPFVFAYDDSNAEKYLAKGDSFLDQAWSSDIARARKANPKVRFSVPKEGAIVFVDRLVILAGTSKMTTAERLIDYLLSPPVAAKNSNFSCAASVDRAARPFIDRELLNGPAYELPDSENKLFFLQELDAPTAARYEKGWQEIKGASPSP